MLEFPHRIDVISYRNQQNIQRTSTKIICEIVTSILSAVWPPMVFHQYSFRGQASFPAIIANFHSGNHLWLCGQLRYIRAFRKTLHTTKRYGKRNAYHDQFTENGGKIIVMRHGFPRFCFKSYRWIRPYKITNSCCTPSRSSSPYT